MRDKKFFSKATTVQIVITLCCLLICTMVVIWVADNRAETITDPEAPLGADSTIMKGDEVKIRIGAPQVGDLYGYQFRLEYDSEQFSANKLKSLIDEIPTIFKKEFDGYILIGATMTGDSPGYSASDTQICELNMTALTDDGAPPEINISKVSVVSSELDYTEDINGWVYEIVADTQND